MVTIEPAAVDSPLMPLDPKKKALLFAMDYHRCAAGWKVINGTANDVGVFTHLLTNTWGFDPTNQTIVSDRTQQTTEALHKAFDDFTAGLEPGDIVALYYSGHGDRVFDDNGDEAKSAGNTATDSFDEGICTTNGHLVDDAIKLKLDAMLDKGVDHIFWFVDACYSGGFVEKGIKRCVVLTSSTDKEKSEDGLRMETDEKTGKMDMFYQGTGTRWLKTAISELYAEGGGGAATTYEQLFEAIQAQRAGDSRKKVQHPTMVASERMRGKAVLMPAAETGEELAAPAKAAAEAAPMEEAAPAEGAAPAEVAGFIVFSDIAAFGVPDGDMRKGSGASDPYVKFTLLADGPEYDGTGPLGGRGGPTCQTEKIANAADPVWEGQAPKLALPTGFDGKGELRVRVWDDDVTNEDDAIGSVIIPVDVSGGSGKVQVGRITLKGREQEGAGGYVLPDFEMSFSYELAPP